MAENSDKCSDCEMVNNKLKFDKEAFKDNDVSLPSILAYHKFVDDEYPKVKESYPNASPDDIVKIVKDRWKKRSSEEPHYLESNKYCNVGVSCNTLRGISDVEIDSTESLDGDWIELTACKENSNTVMFFEIPKTFSKKKGVSVQFELIGSMEASPEDYIGIYSIDSNDISKPLCQKQFELPPNEKIATVTFSAEDLAPIHEDVQCYFMYVQPEICGCGISTLFLIKDEVNDSCSDVSEEDFFVIGSHQLKEENDLLKKNIQILEEDLENKESERAELQMFSEQLKSELFDKETMVKDMQSEIVKSEKLLKSMDEQNKDIIIRLHQQDIKAKSSEDSLIQDVKLLQDALERSEGMCAAVEASKRLVLTELDQEKIRSKNLRLQIADTNVAIVNMKKDSKKLMDDLVLELMERDATIKSINDENETVKMGLRESENTIKNLQKVIQDLSKKISEQEILLDIANQGISGKDEVKFFQEALDQSQDQLKAMEFSKQLALDELEEKKVEFQTQTKELVNCQQMINDLQSEISKLKLDFNVKDDAIEKMMNANIELINNEKKAADRVTLFQTDNEILLTRNTELKLQISKSDKRILEYQKNVIHLRTKLMTLQEELDQIQASKNEKKPCENCKILKEKVNLEQEDKITNEEFKQRLVDGADLYRKQYLKIHSLEKQLTSFKKNGFLNNSSIASHKLQKPIEPIVDSDKNKSPSPDKKEEKLPEKCVIHFSDKEKKNASPSKKIIKDENIQKNAVGPINDSDTGERVLKKGSDYDIKENLSAATSSSEMPAVQGLPKCLSTPWISEYKVTKWKPFQHDSLDSFSENPPPRPRAPSPPYLEEDSLSDCQTIFMRCPSKYSSIKSVSNVSACICPLAKKSVDKNIFEDVSNSGMLIPNKMAKPDIATPLLTINCDPSATDYFKNISEHEKQFGAPILDQNDGNTRHEDEWNFENRNMIDWKTSGKHQLFDYFSACGEMYGTELCEEYPTELDHHHNGSERSFYGCINNYLPWHNFGNSGASLAINIGHAYRKMQANPMWYSSIKSVLPYDDTELQSAECPYCGEIFYTLSHESNSTSSCGIISSREQLWSHLECQHQKAVCPFCGAIFRAMDREIFTRHVNSHFESSIPIN